LQLCLAYFTFLASTEAQVQSFIGELVCDGYQGGGGGCDVDDNVDDHNDDHGSDDENNSKTKLFKTRKQC